MQINVKGTDADVDRIIHFSGWEDRLKELIRNERRAEAAQEQRGVEVGAKWAPGA